MVLGLCLLFLPVLRACFPLFAEAMVVGNHAGNDDDDHDDANDILHNQDMPSLGRKTKFVEGTGLGFSPAPHLV